MKRLFFLVCIIALPIIAYFQYDNYRRHNPSVDYKYHINDAIDKDYYNPSVLKDYYMTAFNTESFAHNAWHEYKIDLKATDLTSEKGQELVRVYNAMLVECRFLENKLLKSSKLKSEGYDNATIKQMMEQGISLEDYKIQQILNNKQLSKGAEGQSVLEIQKLLKQKGYEIPLDGVFANETEITIKEFQTKNQIYPTGKVNDITLKLLLK